MEMHRIQQFLKKSNEVLFIDSLKSLNVCRICSISMFMLIGGNLIGQLSVSTANSAITQNFDGLPSSGTGITASGSIFGNGWSFIEAGSNANLTFQSGTGSGTAGDTYSWGVSGTNALSDRAFGVLQSGSLTSILGFKFTNNTGNTVTSLIVSYTGEQWRKSPSSDILAFSYQLANVSLSASTGWTTITSLNFTTPITGTAAILDGNSPSNRSVLSNVTISGLNISNGSTVTFRWVDASASSSAGMGIDDFSITLVALNPPSAPTITGIIPNNSQLSVDFNAPTSNGGSSITNYIYSTDNGSTWVTPNPAVTGSPFVISNLSAGSTYDVQLKAVNSEGNGTASNTVTATIPNIYSWTGTTSTNWLTATNWNPNGVPDGSIDITIPSSASLTNSPEINSLTINSGKALTLQSGAKLTIIGILTNNGTVNIENGATLVQTGSGSNSGSGTYNVKQTITGSGGVTPNGRFWYLGSPLSNGSSTALLSSTGNQLWQWDETGTNYSSMASSQALTQGKSYVLRSGQSSETVNFSGSELSNGSLGLLNLTRTGTSAQFRGCHLVSNPYPSYLDWDMVGKTNVSTTMYVRTALGSNFNVLETYNSLDQIGTSISGTAMTKDIAPMQGFWVKVTTDGQTGSLALNNNMRGHQSNGAGLRSSAQDFPAFLRFNMLDGENKDQVILFMSPDANTSLDEHDSEKMLATGSAQFYSTVNAKKLVINGMKNVKAKTSVPLTLDVPTSKSYSFQAEEFNIEDGLILLEDKQEGVIQDLTINPVYSFFGNAGMNSTRFVIHFQLAHVPVLVGGPVEMESLGTEDLVNENIQIISDNLGMVIIRMEEGFKPTGTIKVYDASGRIVEQRSFIEQEEFFNFNEKSGIYFIEVTSGRVISKKKIVILH